MNDIFTFTISINYEQLMQIGGFMYTVIAFVLGLILGGGLMWYYWRRYKNTEAFKQEVNERWDEIKDFVKDKLNK